jgi:methionyl-tRNA formyltransferase
VDALVKEGKAPRVAQDLTKGEYEPLCKKMVINWMYPIGVVYNVIRGSNPSPGASTLFRGEPLKIFDCEKRNVSGQKAPGTILEIAADGFLVAGNGGSIFVKRVQVQGSPKVKAAEFVTSAGLQVGEKLG